VTPEAVEPEQAVEGEEQDESRKQVEGAPEAAADSTKTEAPRKDAAGIAVSDEILSSQVVPILEALLYAAEEPIPVKEIVDAMVGVGKQQERSWAADASAIMVERTAMLLSDRLQESGSALQVLEVAGGLRLGTRPQFDPWIRAHRQVEKPSRLSVAALETLAVVAYRQPVTQAEIASVRGVDPAASLRTLRDQGLVRITGRKRAVGRPFTYGTTRQFLEIFGLRDLDELPDPEEFEELLEG
jgi:segregation and condensation protein B